MSALPPRTDRRSITSCAEVGGGNLSRVRARSSLGDPITFQDVLALKGVPGFRSLGVESPVIGPGRACHPKHIGEDPRDIGALRHLGGSAHGTLNALPHKNSLTAT